MEIALDFPDLIRRDELCEKLAGEICELSGIPFRGRRILEGSTILFKTSGFVVKIFSREEPELCVNEAQFLGLLHGKLPVNTPRLVNTGVHKGYPYIIMEEMKGKPLKRIWPGLSRRKREKITEQLAFLLKALHSLPVAELSYTETGWEEFMKNQKVGLEPNHRGFGLDESRINEILRFVESTEPIEETGTRVICHTEIMKEHLFTEGVRGDIRLTGLIDFEPSMAGIPEYDLCSVGLFLTSGERGLFGLFRDVYGYRGSSMEVMRMLLLHRYSNMKWFLSTLPEQMQTNSLESIAEFWYG